MTVEAIAGQEHQDAQPIDGRRREARRRRFGEVARRDRDLLDAEAAGHDLRDDLLIEHEAVRVQREVDALQHLPAEGTVAGVELGERQTERAIFCAREEAVRDVLPPGHPLGQRRAALQPRAEHYVGLPTDDRFDDLRNQPRIVLIVGVHHDHDVGPGAQRLRVARLLVRAITVVLVMDEDLEAELPGDLEGGVGGAVVHEDHEADGVLRQFLVCQAERPPRVVGGHHDDDLRLRLHDDPRLQRRCHLVSRRNLAYLGRSGPKIRIFLDKKSSSSLTRIVTAIASDR